MVVAKAWGRTTVVFARLLRRCLTVACRRPVVRAVPVVTKAVAVLAVLAVPAARVALRLRSPSPPRFRRAVTR